MRSKINVQKQRGLPKKTLFSESINESFFILQNKVSGNIDSHLKLKAFV